MMKTGVVMNRTKNSFLENVVVKNIEIFKTSVKQ